MGLSSNKLAEIEQLLGEVKRLRAATNRYFDVLERQQAEVFGADARELIDAMEQSTVGTRELADARDAVFVLLGRPKDG